MYFLRIYMGGIEIGNQGIKTFVIKISNVEKKNYELVDFWTTNIGLGQDLAKNGIFQ